MEYKDEETYHLFENQDGAGENQKFEFKDSYWNEMASILDQHDAKKKRRRGLVFFFSSSAAITLILFGLFGVRSFQSDAVLVEKSLASLNEGNAYSSMVNLLSKEAGSHFFEGNKGVAEPLLAKKTGILPGQAVNSFTESVEQNSTNMNKSIQTVETHQNQNDLNDIANIEESSEIAEADEEAFALNKMHTDLIENGEPLNLIELNNPVKNKFKLRHHLYYNVETGLANKYQPQKGVSFAIATGIGYELNFHKNLAFQTGVNFIYRDGLSQTYRNESRIYGFHSVRYYQEVNYKGQINIELPIALKMKFNRSSITAGIGTSFLLAVRSSVNQYMPESQNVEQVKNNFGIRDGIRNMDVTLNLSYGYAVTKNMELSAGVSAGLMDQTDNVFFGNDAKDHNLQFRVGLKYFFLNK